VLAAINVVGVVRARNPNNAALFIALESDLIGNNLNIFSSVDDVK
jgi:hypothetical protein